jgi:acyl carrier protein
MFGRKPDPRTWVLDALERMVGPEHAHVPIDEATVLRGIGINSLGLMVLLAEFCERYDIDMATATPDEGVSTVGDLIRAARNLLQKRGS